jgi:carboxyl-terminal processing protease
LIPSVSSKIILWKKWFPIGYIALSIFAQDTDEKLQIEIIKLKNQWISWFILDLRWNGGGLLPESVDVASHFLPIGTPVVQAKYRIYSDTVYKAEWNDTLSYLPTVILVNGFTASASEIITLGIKEWRCKNSISWTWWIYNTWFDKNCDVLIIGEHTFGKWSIQNLQELSFGWSVKLTVGKRFPPSGLSIDHVGIQPDIVIPFDTNLYQKNAFDNQLDKAITVLSQSYK